VPVLEGSAVCVSDGEEPILRVCVGDWVGAELDVCDDEAVPVAVDDGVPVTVNDDVLVLVFDAVVVGESVAAGLGIGVMYA
jgi:hypothetical protein